MKYILILLVLFVACTTSKISVHNSSKTEIMPYKVYKIDSINSYYLIYARRTDSLYKIVSKKEKMPNNSVRITINNSYEFVLRSSLLNRKIGNKTLLPQNSLLVNCFSYDDKTQICLEGDSIRDLYHADNIKGLYFIPSDR